MNMGGLKNWDLPEQIKKRFGKNTFGKQRAMFFEGHLLLILHEPPEKDQRDRKVSFFWRKPDGEWKFNGRGNGFSSLESHISIYTEKEKKLSEKYEKATTSEEYFDLLENLAPLQRASKNLFETMQAAREYVKEDQDIIELRDDAYEVSRNLELLYTDSKNAIDYKIAKKAEEQANLVRQTLVASDRLNVLAAIFFPLTAVASVFGMNLQHGFERAPVLFFWGVFVGGIFIGMLFKNWAFRIK